MFSRIVEQVRVPVSAGTTGVQVLDAMAARGLPFRALFLIGLNEKVFPRFIREDAFLRDGARRILDETLGFKVDQKLTGYDEEALLATLLVGAARQRLYLLSQRADADGRPLAPSGSAVRLQSVLDHADCGCVAHPKSAALRRNVQCGSAGRVR